MVLEIELKDREDIVVMCSNCKSIKENNSFDTPDKELKWIKMTDEPEALKKIVIEYNNPPEKSISHGICYNCMKELYPDFC